MEGMELAGMIARLKKAATTRIDYGCDNAAARGFPAAFE